MPTTLRALADERGFLIGSETSTALLRDPEYAEVLAREFNCLVAAFEMKFKATEPARGVFDFAAGDTLLAFARAHDMQMRGHCLVWHHPHSLPDWFKEQTFSRAEAIAIMQDHITALMEHYRGQIIAWDVVNEGVADEAMYRINSPWYRMIGPDYLELAFRFAHEVDPEAKLFYNDYAMDGCGRKADYAYRLVKDLLARGVPIHGVGLQGHMRLHEAPSLQALQDNIRRFNDLGLEVQFTEADVWLHGEPTEEHLQRQAEVYARLMEAALTAPNCTAFLTWGFTDKHSWVPGFTNGEWGHALLFDEQYRPKPAYRALREVLAR